MKNRSVYFIYYANKKLLIKMLYIFKIAVNKLFYKINKKNGLRGNNAVPVIKSPLKTLPLQV